MRYYYQPPQFYTVTFGRKYICNHPVYTCCTLYEIGDKGLAVIQQRFCPETKTTWWSSIDEWLVDEIFLHPKFSDYFNKVGSQSVDGIFPTVTIRQIMWALKMKPLIKERWESVFDHSRI